MNLCCPESEGVTSLLAPWVSLPASTRPMTIILWNSTANPKLLTLHELQLYLLPYAASSELLRGCRRGADEILHRQHIKIVQEDNWVPCRLLPLHTHRYISKNTVFANTVYIPGSTESKSKDITCHSNQPKRFSHVLFHQYWKVYLGQCIW